MMQKRDPTRPTTRRPKKNHWMRTPAEAKSCKGLRRRVLQPRGRASFSPPKTQFERRQPKTNGACGAAYGPRFTKGGWWGHVEDDAECRHWMADGGTTELQVDTLANGNILMEEFDSSNESKQDERTYHLHFRRTVTKPVKVHLQEKMEENRQDCCSVKDGFEHELGGGGACRSGSDRHRLRRANTPRSSNSFSPEIFSPCPEVFDANLAPSRPSVSCKKVRE